MVTQSPLYRPSTSFKARAYLDGLEKANVSVPSQAKVTNTKRRPHLLEPSVRITAEEKIPNKARSPKEDASTIRSRNGPTYATRARICSYQMGESQDVWEEPAMALQSTSPDGISVPGRTTASQHDVRLQNQLNQVLTVSTHLVHSKRMSECREKLHSEWPSLVARLGQWPPPFTRELWDQT